MNARINYGHLRYFALVAREGSITRVARRLGVRQPTISAQIHALERSLGERLFERQGRRLVVTEIGHVVRRYAEEICSLGDALADVVRGRPHEGPPRFTVGIVDSLPKLTTYRILEPALALPARYRVVLRFDKAERLLAELPLHTLDLVLSDHPAPPAVPVRTFNHLLGECGITIFATAALARRYRRGFPRSIEEAPFLLPTENTALRQSLDQWFAAEGLRPRVVADVEDTAMLQVLGQHGRGLFAAPAVVERAIRRQYRVEIVGRLPHVRERFYALTVERRLTHPAALAISTGARDELFP